MPSSSSSQVIAADREMGSETMASLQDEVDRYKKDLKSARSEISRLVREHRRSSQAASQALNVKKDLELLLRKSEDRITELEDALKRSSGTSSSSSKKSASELAQLEALYETVKADAEESIAAMEKRLAMESEAKEKYRQEIQKLRNENAQLKANSKSPGQGDDALLVKEREQRALVEAQLAVLQKDLKGLQQQQPQGNEVVELRKLVQELETRLKEAAQHGDPKAHEREALLKETTEALYEWKDECELLQKQLVDYEAEIDALSAELDQMQTGKGGAPSNRVGSSARLQATLREKEKELAQAVSELDSAQKRFQDELNGLSSKHDGHIEEKQQEIVQLQTKVSEMETEVNTYKATIRDQTSKLEEMVKKLDVAATIEESLRAGYQRCEELRGKFEQELEQMNAETSQLTDWSRSIMRTFSKL